MRLLSNNTTINACINIINSRIVSADAFTSALYLSLACASCRASYVGTSSNDIATVSGWSSDINDYQFIERLGRNTLSHVMLKWYGSNAAVYRARLPNDAITRSVINGVPSYECSRDLVVKVVYNYDDSMLSQDKVSHQP